MKKIAFVSLFVLGIFIHVQTVYAQNSDYKYCIDAVMEDPNLYPLKEKVALGTVDKQNFQMLTNVEYASSDEKPLIASWVESRRRCFAINQTSMSVSLPDPIYQAFKFSVDEFDLLAAQLYSGSKTYGDFAQQRSKLNTFVMGKINEYSNAATARQNQYAQENEQARRNAIIQQLMNRPQTQPYQMQPYMMPTKPTTTTNCTTIGNQVNCVSR